MYKKGLAYKILSFFSLLNLSLQPFFNFLLISTPAFVLAQEQIEAGITFDKGKNSFNLTVNKQGEIHYELFYRTDSQIENVSGTSKNNGENFSQEIYAGTCSSGGVCTPHQVLRGILKIEVKSEGWLSSKRFTIDNGNLNLVEESTASDLNLTDEENSWLENPDQQQIEKECLTNQSLVDTKDEDWNINIEKGIAETKEKVKLGVKYIFPLEDKVSVSFQCLPKEGATPLKIQKVKISDLNLPEGVNPYGEWAYDITTGMQDGTFEYEMTLSKPKGVEAKVIYIEKSLEEIEEGLEAKEIKEVGKDNIEQKKDEEKVEVKGLDHFTVFTVLASTPPSAGEATVIKCVNPDGSGGCYKTIGEAIHAASAGDTIKVAEGTYKEQIAINKSLTLVGAGVGKAIITAPQPLEPAEWKHRGVSFAALIEVNGKEAHGIEVNISGFTIDGNGEKVKKDYPYTGIVYHNADGKVSGNKIIEFKNVRYPTERLNGWGIFVVEGSNVIIDSNTINNCRKGGIVVDGDENYETTDVKAAINKNVIEGAGKNDSVTQNGVQVSGGATASITNNTISKNYYSGSDKSMNSSGVLLYYSNDVSISENNLEDNQIGIRINGEREKRQAENSQVTNNVINNNKYGVAISHAKNTTVEKNKIESNEVSGLQLGINEIKTIIEKNNITGNNTSETENNGGIVVEPSVGENCGQIGVHLNNIVKNKEFGVYNASKSNLDATLNWWGAQTGPSDAAGGEADSVSSNVLYKEWLCEPYETSWYSVGGKCSTLASCPMNGAIWTTEFTCTDVNKNLYSSKKDVYLNGGPHSSGSDGLNDGSYYVRVTNPGGQDILGQSPYPNVTVSNGSIVGCLRLWDLVSYTEGIEIKQGYKDTTNSGGAYKVWLSPDPDFKDCHKTDSFKVLGDDYEPGCGNGIVEQGEDCDNDGPFCTKCTYNYVCNPKENLIVNGGFEYPVVNNDYGWDTYQQTEPYLGWFIDWVNENSEYDPNLELHRAVENWSPAQGAQWAELDSDFDGPGGSINGESASISIYQNIPTIDGYEYRVEFAFSPRPKTPESNNKLEFKLDGVVVDTYLDSGAGDTDTTWSEKKHTFVGKGGPARIQFTDRGISDSYGTFIDDVRVYCLGKEMPECVENGEEESVWADEVESVVTGTLYNDNEITAPIRINPEEALGKADGDFYSLGKGGEIILNFYYYIKNVEGDDLSIHEITWDRPSDIEETAEVWVKNDNTDWILLGKASSFADGNNDTVRDGINYFDFSDVGLAWINSVKVVESSTGQTWDDDGFDLDAVDATQRVCEEPVIECGDGVVNQESEECDGIDGVTEGENFCTPTCKLVPIYDGEHKCPTGTEKSEEPILTKQISSKDADGEFFSLTAKGKYLFEVSGIFTASSGGHTADAAYTFKGELLQSQYGIWGVSPDLGAHALLADFGGGVGIVHWDEDKTPNEDNVYTKYYEPTTSNVQFVISDRYEDWFGTAWDNQKGIGDNSGNLTLNVYECQPVSDVTICKTDGKNNLPNWRIALIGDSVESFSVPSNGSSVEKNYPIGNYVVKASGIYNYGSVTMNADAANSFRYAGLSCSGGVDSWVNGDASSCLNHYLNLNPSLSAGPTNAGWGDYYNPSHLYYKDFAGGDLNLKIWDSCGTSGEGCYGDNEGSLNVDVYRGYSGDTEENGCVTFSNVPYGDYSIEETMQDGWKNISGLGDVEVNHSEEKFNIVNRLDLPVTIVATKIVCDDESDLPDWGRGAADITKDTATVWLSSHPNCRLEKGWDFQWGDDSVANPGDGTYGPVVGWNTFGPTGADGKATTTISDFGNTSQIKVREVLQEGYIPFTYTVGGNNSNDVSAEIYCDTDVLNYDNDDRFTPEYGKTYYCVGFNAPKYGSISGMKFEDVDGNGIKDVGDNGLKNWTIQLKQGDVIVDSTTTDVNGLYSFSKVLTDDYQVCEVEQPDWTRTYPSGSNCQPVTVVAGQKTTDINFGNFKLGSISGTKIYDKDDDGIQDDGEGGIEGWNIYLNLSGGSLKKEISTTTDSDGNYKFTGLAAGDYTVREEKHAGWRASKPESGKSGSISISSGTNAKFDFFNAPPASLKLLKSNNAAAPVKPGDPVEYTLTITVGERTLSEMTLIDILPNGFSYQTGTTSIATTLGGLTTTAHTEPTLKHANKRLVWTWPTGVAGGSIVVIKYTVKIDTANKPSSYNNLAYVWGSGSPTMVESQIVDSVVKIEPAYTPEGKVAGGEVLSAATQTTEQIEGEVLGATLPAAGANTWFLLAAIALIGTGFALRPKKENRQKN